MKCNAGKWDRILRVVVGAGVLSLAFVGPQTAWGYIGLVPIFTGLVGYCPAYSIVGLNTCNIPKK
ncbi:MAG: DUF2892 domain-containing protein [Bdellovibrionaceae bacterium]|nr:DUF2892 domain-containing protein [Pseudobdellovibrionaceae bacterium]